MARLRRQKQETTSQEQQSGEKNISGEVKASSVPTWTLRADRRFDILALVHVAALAEAGNVSPELRAELKKKLREFELYEEAHLR